MTTFNKSLSANLNSSGNLTMIRWYSGAFKNISLGTIRAVYRAVKMITQNRNLI